MPHDEDDVQQLRELSPYLPSVTGALRQGWILIVTSIPTVSDTGKEAVGGNGCSTTADEVYMLAHALGIPVAPVIHQGDRMRLYLEKQKTNPQEPRNTEGNVASNMPNAQREIGKDMDKQAFDEAIEQARAGKLVILEAKFGALLAGYLAEIAPMIPIMILGIDCEHHEATQRKLHVRQQRGDVGATLENTEVALIQRLENDNNSARELYKDNVPDAEFSRKKQLQLITDLLNTTKLTVQQSGKKIISHMITRWQTLEDYLFA